jgi:succinate-acetate transporter protein
MALASERSEPIAVTTANPAPLGLSAFALTTFVLSCNNAGILFTSGAPFNIVVGLALFYGGLGQILAAMWEFRAGNTFGATAFASYGGFWLAFGVLLLPASGGLAAYTSASALHSALGVFLLAWAIFTFIMLLASFRTTGALVAVFALLFLTFLFLAIGEFSVSTTMHQIGGWLGILTAIAAWYTALAGVLATGTSFFRLPTFPLA